MKLSGYGLSDVGMTRKNNEDSFSVDNESELYIVADGVGGHSSGEVASRMVADLINDYMQNIKDREFVGKYDDAFAQSTNNLASAVRFANQIVFQSSRSNPALNGMSSTVVAVSNDDGLLSIVHVGDSRAYIIRENTITQLTDDHSLVMEQVRQGLMTEADARESKVKNVITRAMGATADVEADMDEIRLGKGDRLILCSDGLSNMVTDENMLDIVMSGLDPEAVCRRLVDTANANGGKDNVTVVYIEAEKKSFFSFLSRLW